MDDFAGMDGLDNSAGMDGEDDAVGDIGVDAVLADIVFIAFPLAVAAGMDAPTFPRSCGD